MTLPWWYCSKYRGEVKLGLALEMATEANGKYTVYTTDVIESIISVTSKEKDMLYVVT